LVGKVGGDLRATLLGQGTRRAAGNLVPTYSRSGDIDTDLPSAITGDQEGDA